jgi:branched-chain amino acid transport system permease protein
LFPQIVANGLIAGVIYALIALGFSIIYKTVRFFHLAHGAPYIGGAYAVYACLTLLPARLGIGTWFIALPVGIAVAAGLGVGIDRGIYYPLRSRKASNLIFLLASFGILIFVQNLVTLAYGNRIIILNPGIVKEGWRFLRVLITPIQVLIVAASILTFGLCWWIVAKTRLGRAIRAVADDRVGASVCGINPERTTMWAVLIGSALAGVAGILISLETNLEPTMGFNAILKGIIASIIGGIGSIPGALVGGIFLGLVENIGIAFIPAGWKDAIAFAVLILFLLLRPQGIFGRRKG